MATLEKAIEIAARAHAGQVDKAEQPYILHPLRVMFRVAGAHERMAAVLHDVVEDTSVTLEDLRQQGFPEEVLEAVDVLTKQDGETRTEAARRAVQHPIARRVKIADVTDNMDVSRLDQLTEHDVQRMKEYVEVLAILRAHGAT